jgi:general stress protein 26
MNEQELLLRAVELIKTIPYLNLATSLDDRPWSSPIYAVHDNDLNFYWSSWKEALHSTNLSSNRRTSFTIYDSSRKRGTNNYRCLYMTATVAIVENKSEAEKASQMLYPEDRIDLTDFLAQGLKRIYKATPQQAWLNCLSERELTPSTLKMRTELDVSAIKAAT